MNDRSERNDSKRDDLPGPATGTDTGTSGNVDERSSENRREGLRKDQDGKPVRDGGRESGKERGG